MKFEQDILDQMNDNSLYKLIGIQIQKAAGGKACSRLEPNQKVCWPSPTQPHGGVLFTLMDTTMAWAVLSQLDQGKGCTTIHLDIQYTLPARGNLFTCSAGITHRTRRLSFVRGEIYDKENRLLATGQSTFRVIRNSGGAGPF